MTIRERPLGVFFISLFEIVVGLYGTRELIELVTFEKRTGATAGLGVVIIALVCLGIFPSFDGDRTFAF